MIEFSEEEEAVMAVSYNGPLFDVTARGEELSLKVLKSIGSEMDYTRDENAEYPNRVLLQIREE